MPYSAPRPCRFVGCAALVRNGTLCDAHRRTADTYDNRRPSSHGRGYTRQWGRLRNWYLARHPICQWPGCEQPASQVDHVVPLARGGSNDTTNLQGLCAHHHSIKTNSFDGGFGRQPVTLYVGNSNTTSSSPESDGFCYRTCNRAPSRRRKRGMSLALTAASAVLCSACSGDAVNNAKDTKTARCANGANVAVLRAQSECRIVAPRCTVRQEGVGGFETYSARNGNRRARGAENSAGFGGWGGRAKNRVVGSAKWVLGVSKSEIDGV